MPSSKPDASLTEAAARLDATVLVLGETIEGDTVTLTYSVGAVRGTATCVMDEERDDRGPFDYVFDLTSDHDADARVVEALEAAALEAWGRRFTADADEWMRQVHGETTVRIPHQTLAEVAAEWHDAQAVSA